MRESTLTRSPVGLLRASSGKSANQPLAAVKASLVPPVRLRAGRVLPSESVTLNSALKVRVCSEPRALASVVVIPGMSLIA